VNGDRYARVKAILLVAHELNCVKRTEYLAQACQG
jgi:hypothetical protein